MGSKEGARKAREKMRQKYTKEEISKIMSKAGKKGGQLSTGKFDSESARKAVQKRWEKKDGNSS